MEKLLLIPLIALLTRACGAAWNRIPQLEIAFAAPFGYVAYHNTGIWWVGLLGWFITYLAMQTGHGNFWQMEGAEDGAPEHIEYLVREFYTGDIHKPRYSWVCMGLKGLLLGLAAFPFGVLLAVLWPLAYHINFIVLDRPQSDWAEWIAGAFAGLIITIAIF